MTMAGRTRSTRPNAATWRGPLAALVACTLAACSSGTAASSGPVPDPNAYQDPPGNPQEALLNGEVPLSNQEQPPGNAEEAPTNAEQPNAPNGSSGGSASVTSSCNNFCVNVGVNCSRACANLCGEVSTVVAPCLAAASRYVSCITGLSVICNGNGRLEVSGPRDACNDEASSLTDCVNAGDIKPPRPAANASSTNGN